MEDKQQKLKTIFVTGGHFTPAKAVVDELLKSKNWQIFYIGRKHALEGDKAISLEFQEMASHPNVHFLPIVTGRPQRRFTSRTIPSLLKIPVGLVQSLIWILQYRPVVILTFGGYVAFPFATWGFFLGIPVVNHEQIPAFDYSSKYLGRIATKVLVSFKHLLPAESNSKWIFTGNPVREEIFDNQPTEELKSLAKEKLPTIYLTGGNQGSHILNDAMHQLLPEILKDYTLIWQTGDSQYHDFEAVEKTVATLPEKLQKRLILKKFILGSEIGAVFNQADLVIGRSGANTVCEVAALAKSAIFVPIPWVHDQEQLRNAESYASFGAAIILSQVELSPKSLNETITKWADNKTQFTKAAKEAQKAFPKDASSKIAVVVNEVAS